MAGDVAGGDRHLAVAGEGAYLLDGAADPVGDQRDGPGRG
jgi:hypothetical protein